MRQKGFVSSQPFKKNVNLPVVSVFLCLFHTKKSRINIRNTGLKL